MATQSQITLSPEDYLALERTSSEKHEYYRGEIFAMGGASPTHNLIVMNTGSELRQQLKKRPCRVYANDMRVKVDPSGLYTYPDLVVTCGGERFDDAQKDTLLNPKLLIEVLSKSTEAYDRGDKFGQFRKIESLLEYILINQDKAHIERFIRQDDNRWQLSEVSGLEAVIRLDAIDCELVLAEIYDKVELST
jgi:Uma2 family endonuclease